MITRAYVENGAKVYITSRNVQACEDLARELKDLPGSCIPIAADLSRMEELEALAEEISRREDRLHILVNNAGMAWGEPIKTFPEAGWDRVMDLNVKSVFFLTQKLIPLLEAAANGDDWGRVINIGSIAGLHVGSLSAPSYSASKAAVIHLSRVLAAGLARWRIAVNCIAPGYFPTKMTDGIRETMGDAVKEATPMKRWGKPEDMAGLALYLGSAASAYTTGSVINIDGGLETTL